METAIYLNRAAQLQQASSGFTRLYFGQEFCDRLLPSPEELRQALTYAHAHGLSFTWVTPYLTTAGLERCLALDALVAEALPGAEVVLNDWGHLRGLKTAGVALTPVLGRLLTKQKRGPRTVNLLPHLTPAAIEHFQDLPANLPHYRDWLVAQGFARLELDNLVQGFKAADAPLTASLYYPFAYVSTTRWCLSNDGANPRKPARLITACARDCRRFSFTLRHPDMPLPLYLKGNTLFIQHPGLPPGLPESHISRTVFEPELPL